MRILLVVLLMFFGLPAMAETTYLSTLSYPPQSDNSVSNNGSVYQTWGLPFTTGAGGQTFLNQVTVVLQAQPASASPLSAALYLADGEGLPTGAAITTNFTWGAVPTGSFGEVAFTPGVAITLDAGVTYVFALSTGTGGNYLWQTASDPAYDATGGWSFPTPFVMAWSTNEFGSPAWTNGGGGVYHLMGAIAATPVPEPATAALVALGLLGLVLRGRRRYVSPSEEATRIL